MTEPAAVELDYAFPAQWARVNADGTLTAVDASFLRVTAPLGMPMSFAVAARLRFRGGLTACDFRVEVRPPQGAALTFDGRIDATGAPQYGEEQRRHMLVALNSGMVVQEYGAVTIELFLDDRSVRTLMFEVVPLPDTQQSAG